MIVLLVYALNPVNRQAAWQESVSVPALAMSLIASSVAVCARRAVVNAAY